MSAGDPFRQVRLVRYPSQFFRLHPGRKICEHILPPFLDLSTLSPKGTFVQGVQTLSRFFACSGVSLSPDRAAARALISASLVHFAHSKQVRKRRFLPFNQGVRSSILRRSTIKRQTTISVVCFFMLPALIDSARRRRRSSKNCTARPTVADNQSKKSDICLRIAT